MKEKYECNPDHLVVQLLFLTGHRIVLIFIVEYHLMLEPCLIGQSTLSPFGINNKTSVLNVLITVQKAW